MALISIKVTPNAKQSEILGWVDIGEGSEALRVKLKAPPVDGKANKALVAFLSNCFDVPKNSVTILRGEKSRLKTVEIGGLNEDEIRDRLQP